MTIGDKGRRTVGDAAAAVFTVLAAIAAAGEAMAHMGEPYAAPVRTEIVIEARATGPQAADAECARCEQVADIRPSGAMIDNYDRAPA